MADNDSFRGSDLMNLKEKEEDVAPQIEEMIEEEAKIKAIIDKKAFKDKILNKANGEN